MPFLDHLISNSKMRFPEDELTAYPGFYIIPLSCLPHQIQGKKNILLWLISILKILHESMVLFRFMAQSLENATTEQPNSIPATLKMIDSVAFPNVSISLTLKRLGSQFDPPTLVVFPKLYFLKMA